MKIHQGEIEAALASLYSRHSGLTVTEVEKYLREYVYVYVYVYI